MSQPSFIHDNQTLSECYEALSVHWQLEEGRTLLDALDIREGQQVLDIGSGTGALTEEAAQRAAPTGTVIGIEPLELRVQAARKRARPGLSFEIGDAQHLSQFEAGRFDAAYMNFVFHWIIDKPQALLQIHRVLRKGARLGIVSGAGDKPSEIVQLRRRVLARPRFAAHSGNQTGESRHLSVEAYRALLEQTGFAVEVLREYPKVNIIPGDAEAALGFLEASSFGNYTGHLPPGLRAEARAIFLEELRRFETAEGFRFKGTGILAIARRA